MTGGEAAVLVETVGHTLVVTLNRPAARNAIDQGLADELVSALDELDTRPDLAVGVLTGAGGGFSAGMDLKAFAASGAPRRLTSYLRTGTRKPLIAAVDGFAVGGGLELALTCDVIVASEGAKFALPEATLGLIAAGGGLVRLAGRLSYGLAMELVLSGRSMLADEALRHGLVTRLAPAGQPARDVAMELAERMAASAPLALVASKRILAVARREGEEAAWTEQRALARSVFTSADAREGALAFRERRSPQWSGS